MAINWDALDKEFNTAELAKEVLNAPADGGNRAEVPHGEYEVKITKLELTTSKSSKKPMVSIWFKVLNGAHEGGLIFMNQVVTEPFQFHIMNDFLRELDSGVDVTFESYKQYASVLMDIHEKIDGKHEYALKYDQNAKGYNTFEILEVFDVE